MNARQRMPGHLRALPDGVSPAPVVDAPEAALDALAAWIDVHAPVLLLSGAGISTASGVGDYRNAAGEWKRKPPVTVQEFLASEHGRRRYWARSLVGWPQFRRARPNPAHVAVTALERAGLLTGVVTQNVDRLHQQAGTRNVVDLHGRLDRVVCLDCGRLETREAVQERLAEANGPFLQFDADAAPDGDADLEGVAFDGFVLPTCTACGGTLKPDVVFFGENVPRERVDQAYAWLETARGLLVTGSSLMVYSGFRFARKAAQSGRPIVLLNQGRTRADELAALRAAAPLQHVLPAVAGRLAADPGPDSATF